MRKLLAVLILSVVLVGCNQRFKKVVKNAVRPTILTTYEYEYADGRKVKEKQTDYTVVLGIPADSSFLVTSFIYNEKGQLVKEYPLTEGKSSKTSQIFNYGPNDSLISNLSIGPNGDTVFWYEYAYFPDGRKIIFDRAVILNPDSITPSGTMPFETIIHYVEYQYERGVCIRAREYGTNHLLTSTTIYHYKNGKRYKEEIFKPGETGTPSGLPAQTIYYDYSIDTVHYNWVRLNSHNDTVAGLTNHFSTEHQLIMTVESDAEQEFPQTVYYKNGRQNGSVRLNLKRQTKTITTYSYYPNGDIRSLSYGFEDILQK